MRLPTWHIQRLHDVDANRLTHALTAFGAGFLFSLAIAPCATPILLGILTLVAMQGDLFWGGLLMFIYGLGTGLPLLLIGHGYERLQPWLTTPRRQRGLRTISRLLSSNRAFMFFGQLNVQISVWCYGLPPWMSFLIRSKVSRSISPLA